MKNYDTVSEAVNCLLKRGYNTNFNMDESELTNVCTHAAHLFPGDFKIDEVHRFEGITDPADEAIVFAISSERFSMKGVIVNGYGMYAESLTSAVMKDLG